MLHIYVKNALNVYVFPHYEFLDGKNIIFKILEKNVRKTNFSFFFLWSQVLPVFPLTSCHYTHSIVLQRHENAICDVIHSIDNNWRVLIGKGKLIRTL